MAGWTRRLAAAVAFLAVVGLASCSETDGERVPSGVDEVRVTRIIDGDTIEVEDGGDRIRVRFIGVDAPEFAHDGGAEECYAREATSFVDDLLSDAWVRLEFDVERSDRFGRSLAYVWLGDRFVNRVLVEEGLVEAKGYPPNLRHQDALSQAERSARERSAGLWGPACRGPGA